MNEVRRALIDPQPRLELNLETTHCHGVSDDLTGDRVGSIRERYSDWLASGVMGDFQGI